MTDKYQTRDGLTARVLCVNLNRPLYPVVAAITNEDGIEVIWYFTDEGRFINTNVDRVEDLIPKPKRIKGWINVYPYCYIYGLYPTKKEADENADPQRIACIEIDVEEGEGL